MFDRDQYRLDDYLFDISRFPAIAEVSHFILTLSHGQADMERGFSVYKKVGQVNKQAPSGGLHEVQEPSSTRGSSL